VKHQNAWIGLIGILLALLLWLAFFWEPARTSDIDPRTPHTPLPVAEIPTGGDFTLQSPSGAVALADFRGKVVLLYFGYTFCPDVCPTSLAALAQALSALAPGELEKVQGLFISVDPERDTMDVLKIYVPYFHPGITGLSGTPEQLAQVARLYGARYMKQKPDADGLYSVDHSAFTYLIATDGTLVDSLPHGTSPEQIVDKIRTQLKAKTP